MKYLIIILFPFVVHADYVKNALCESHSTAHELGCVRLLTDYLFDIYHPSMKDKKELLKICKAQAAIFLKECEETK